MLHNFWVAITEATEAMVSPQDKIRLSDGLRIDMEWWARALLATREGRSYAKREWIGENWKGVGDTPCSDASDTGMGGHVGRRVWQHKYTEKEKEIIKSSGDIQVGEAQSMLITTWTFSQEFAGKNVSFGCDNSSVVLGAEGEKARDIRTQTVLRHLAWVAIKGDFHLSVFHLPRTLNKMSDLASKYFPLQDALNGPEVRCDKALLNELLMCELMPDPCSLPGCPLLLQVLSEPCPIPT
jgi:hypothetical protein